MATGMTKLENLINPEVMADMIAAELKSKIKLQPIAQIDNTLVGQPGDTLTVPKWEYIGDAEDITEGDAISITQMGKTDTKMKVKQAGKGVEITDVAALSGYGDPIGEANRQITLSIASKIDNDIAATLKGATAEVKSTAMTVDALLDAKDKFADEDEYKMYIVLNPSNAIALRKDAAKNWLAGTELGAEAVTKGIYGEVDGVQVIRTNKIEKNVAYLVKEGAIKIVMKRDVKVEKDRDILKKTTVITADEHYGTYLYDPTKVVKVTIGA